MKWHLFSGHGVNPFLLTTLYLYHSLEFSFVCTFFSYQHPDIICVNINFQVVSSQKLCCLRLPFAYHDMFLFVSMPYVLRQ